MRLTLRTMLAYLDKVLDPQDAVELGKKIEESQFAKDLMHRIEAVLRRLRLGAPKVDGRGLGLDPNTVAEYLDNTMPAERVADLERICLESDVHLAEVAACHQILDLVLREPVEVSEQSKRRMYSLPQLALELAARPVHDTPATSRTPPPLDAAQLRDAPATTATTQVNSAQASAAVVNHTPAPGDLSVSTTGTVAAAESPSAGETGVRQLEIPDYLKSPPARKRGNPALALVSILAMFVAIGVFLLRTQPGRDLLAHFTSSVDTGTDAEATSKQIVNTKSSDVSQPNAPGDGSAPTSGGETVPVAPNPPPLTGSPVTTNPVPAPMPANANDPATTTPPGTANTAPSAPGGNVAPLPSGTTSPPGTLNPGTVGLPAMANPAGTTNPAAGQPTIPASAPVTAPAATNSGFTPVLPGKQSAAPATQPVTITPPSAPMPPVPAPAAPSPPPVAVVAMGTLSSTDQITVVASAVGSNVWKRLVSKAPVSSGERILSLPGYRSSLGLAYGLNVQLLGGTLVELVAPDARGIPGVVVQYGRMIVAPDGKADAELRVGAGDKQGQIQFLTGDTTIALEVRSVLVPGQDPVAAQAPRVIELYVVQGEIRWIDPITGNTIPIKSANRFTLGVPQSADPQGIPSWLVSDDRNEQEKLAAPVMEKAARGDRAITLALKELSDDRRGEVRLLALRSLMYLEECEALVVALRDEAQSRNWDAQIDALREAIALSPDSALRVKQAFESHRGPAKGGELFRMLWGYSGDQLREGGAAKLVATLDHDDLDARVLSFYTLRQIAPRTVSTYRPNSNAATRRPQIVKWEQLLERGDLFPKN